MWHEGQGRRGDDSRFGTGGMSIREIQLWNAGSAGLFHSICGHPAEGPRADTPGGSLEVVADATDNGW